MSERIVNDPSQHGWVEVDGKWMWGGSGGGSGAGMVISETEPTDKVEGMQWLNPTTGLVLFWDDEKWLQMPGGKDGKDGADAQDGADGGIEEAPNDGLQYARQSEGWAEVKGGVWTDEGGDDISYRKGLFTAVLTDGKYKVEHINRDDNTSFESLSLIHI